MLINCLSMSFVVVRSITMYHVNGVSLVMGLREYIIRRSIYMFLLVVAVVCFNFFLFRLPTFLFGANPVSLMLSDDLRAHDEGQAEPR